MLNTTKDAFPLLLDSEKAYNRVSHEWLQTCLIKSGLLVSLTTLILNILLSTSVQIITNNCLSFCFKIQSRVWQGDPLAPILFILLIEPLLRDLKANQIHVQSHCDDLAVVATSSTLQSSQDSLHTYEQSSGALLNSSKSFLITKQHLPNSLFPTSAISQRYLGFHLNSRGRYVLPPHLIDECTEALQRIKKLPLSLAGRMTVLSSYIRP